MIPRLRPPFSLGELLKASIRPANDAIGRFEREFAEKFGFSHGLFFPYGRSALYALLRALEWRGEEVVLPAYICVVVPNAIVLSGNRVRFVDSEPDHFNVSAEGLSLYLSPSTKMIIPTPLYGFPVDRRGYEEAIARRAPRAFVLWDIAQAYGVKDQDGLQTDHAHGAFVGLGMGKLLSSIEGGMLLLRDEAIYRKVRDHRRKCFSSSGAIRSLKKWILGIGTYWALREPFLSLTDWLESRSDLLDRYNGEIPVDRGPFLPDNAMEMPTALQAKLGSLQLLDYERIIAHRRETASRYEMKLKEAGFPLFSSPSPIPPTFAQFPLRVGDRERVQTALRKHGIQARASVPHACSDLAGYEAHRGRCPNAALHARRILVLPNWYGMTLSQVDRVVEGLIRCRNEEPDIFPTS